MATRPDPLGIVVFRGKRMDRKTATALAIAERRLGYELSITQGAYNPGAVGASGGTHDRGGVVDLPAFDHVRKVQVLRNLGFAAWYRPTIPGLWAEHIHAVMIGHQDLAPAAAAQVAMYKLGLDGLANRRPDPNPYRPKVAEFSYAAAWRDDILTTRIKGINARIKTLQDRASEAKRKLTYRKALKNKPTK